MPTIRSSHRLRFGPNSLLASATLAIAALSPYAAHAALGQPYTSIEADGAKLQGSIKATDHELYRVNEIEVPGGTLIREYTALDGNVFAVTWSGPFMPNLRQTLGQYFDRYVAAARNNHADHRHLQIHDNDFVVQSAGHQHAFAGRAYLPEALPNGVSVGDLL